ncbi:C6 finger domain [Cordyceps militaris]|uniref:C6 finger domain n=1 Tax=Cordyceps militaris TaxID=73501 RepID=A0A2H4SBN0_CORMI|nr:C6 finger domain [Cordyceps militaris]
MRTSRYASTRQKSCQQCSSAKARCDRKEPGCSRCAHRRLVCTFPPVSSAPLPETSFRASIPSPGSDFSVHPPALTASHASSSNPPDEADTRRGLDFARLRLACPIDVERIQNRWLNPYLEQPDQIVKEYPPKVTRFIFRVLKSYAAVAARGRVALPFVHPTQMDIPGSHLATCLSLARVSDNPLPGSEDAAAAILQREMDSITANDLDAAGHLSTLAAFQAYLIYILILFFHLNQGPSPFFRTAMTTLQGLACVTSRMGLVCAADATHTRPRWEEWIITEAKRRTLYVMYLLDSVLSDQENLPTYLGTELRGLPVPSNKALWQAPTRAAWEMEYNMFLAEWSERQLTIDELWSIPPDMDDAGIVRRRRRVDHWLENLDEFGTMLFAVTCCTHGEL